MRERADTPESTRVPLFLEARIPSGSARQSAMMVENSAREIVGSQNGSCRITRCQMNYRKNDNGYNNQNRNNRKDPFNDEIFHGVSLPSSPESFGKYSPECKRSTQWASSDTPLYAPLFSFCNCVTFYCPNSHLSININAQEFSAYYRDIYTFYTYSIIFCLNVIFLCVVFIMLIVVYV